MRRLIPSVSALGITLLALTACGGGGEDPAGGSSSAAESAPEQSESSSQPVDTGQSLDSVDELKNAVTDAGLTCDGGEAIEGDGYKESMSCGDNVWLVVFDDDGQQSEKVSQYEEDGSNYLEGENWVVVAPQDALDKISS